jgi:hypothetical protein
MACNKSTFDDLSGQGTLKGVAVIYDTLNGYFSYAQAPNLKIYLKKAEDLTGYLYSTTSGSQAQYSFSGIEMGKSYKVYAGTDSGAVKLYGELNYTAGGFADGQSDSLKLFPSETNQNGIHLILQDSAGGRMANTTAWVFSSPLLFNGDSSIGKIFDMVTNTYGVNNRFNLAPAKYYIRVNTKVGNINLKGTGTVDVSIAGIKTLLIPVARYSPNLNGFVILVNDITHNAINNVQIYVYRSRTVFFADATGVNSDYQLNSNISGQASMYNIDSARYYLRFIKQAGSATLTRLDSVDVDRTHITNQSYILN